MIALSASEGAARAPFPCWSSSSSSCRPVGWPSKRPCHLPPRQVTWLALVLTNIHALCLHESDAPERIGSISARRFSKPAAENELAAEAAAENALSVRTFTRKRPVPQAVAEEIELKYIVIEWAAGPRRLWRLSNLARGTSGEPGGDPTPLQGDRNAPRLRAD